MRLAPAQRPHIPGEATSVRTTPIVLGVAASGTVAGPHRSARSKLMPSAFTTCTGMSGIGRRTAGTTDTITAVRHRMTVGRGRPIALGMLTGWFAADPVATSQPACARSPATGTPPTCGAPFWVSVSPARLLRLEALPPYLWVQGASPPGRVYSPRGAGRALGMRFPTLARSPMWRAPARDRARQYVAGCHAAYEEAPPPSMVRTRPCAAGLPPRVVRTPPG